MSRVYCLMNVAVYLQELAERLERFNEFSGQAQLRQMLASRGGISSQTDIIGKRLAELKGLEAPEEAFRR